MAPVEAKRDHRQNAQKLVSQLVDYLRLTMVKQQDRRFALGLILSCDELSVWCLDRSGVLGMDVPIKIHEVRRVLCPSVRFCLTWDRRTQRNSFTSSLHWPSCLHIGSALILACSSHASRCRPFTRIDCRHKARIGSTSRCTKRTNVQRNG